MDGGYPRRWTESLMTSMALRGRSGRPELSARIPGGRPGSERAGFGLFSSFITSNGPIRSGERSCAVNVAVALSAVVVTAAPFEMFSHRMNCGRPASQPRAVSTTVVGFERLRQTHVRVNLHKSADVIKVPG